MKLSPIIPLIGLAVCMVFPGCGSSGSRSDSEYSASTSTAVNPTVDSVTVRINIKDATPLAEAFSEVTTIRFDEEEDDLIGDLHNIVVRGDTIYAIDTYKAPGIYAYRRDGSLIFAYCAYGNGPEEFFDLLDLCVDPTEITAYDRGQSSLIVIDKEGKFKKKIKMAEGAVSGIRDNNGDYWVSFTNQTEGPEKLSWRPDSMINYVCVLPVPESVKGLRVIPLHQLSKLSTGEVVYTPPVEPRIYNLNRGKATLRYEFDFDGLWPDEGGMEKYRGHDWALKLRDFPVGGLHVFESDKYLLVGFRNEGNLYAHIYNKQTKEGNTYVDKEGIYYYAKYITDDEMFFSRNDDGLDALKL